jgi:predicted Zn-dependent protease
MSNLAETAHAIQQLAMELGADEAAVSVSQSISTELTQRKGLLEKT